MQTNLIGEDSAEPTSSNIELVESAAEHARKTHIPRSSARARVRQVLDILDTYGYSAGQYKKSFEHLSATLSDRHGVSGPEIVLGVLRALSVRYRGKSENDLLGRLGYFRDRELINILVIGNKNVKQDAIDWLAQIQESDVIRIRSEHVLPDQNVDA